MARVKPALVSIDLESDGIVSEKSLGQRLLIDMKQVRIFARARAEVYAPDLLTVHSHDLNGAIRASCDCGRNASQ